MPLTKWTNRQKLGKSHWRIPPSPPIWPICRRVCGCVSVSVDEYDYVYDHANVIDYVNEQGEYLHANALSRRVRVRDYDRGRGHGRGHDHIDVLPSLCPPSPPRQYQQGH